MKLNLSADCKIIKASDGATAAETEVDSDIVDTAGFAAVCWIVDLGTVTSGSVLTAQAQGNSANSSAGMTNAGDAATHTDDGDSSNTVMVVDVLNPQNRYQRLKLTRTTANAVVNSIIAILYRAKEQPVTPDATVLASALSVAAN